MVVDPVCKMQVDEAKAKHISTHKGKKYHFCNEKCKKTFDQAPEKYMQW